MPNVSSQSEQAARQNHRIGSLSTGDVVPRRRNKDPRLGSSGVERGFEGHPVTRSIKDWLSTSPSTNAPDSDDSRGSQSIQCADLRSQRAPNEALGTNLPDLRALMYPSTNPFEYGNQPLSILEDHQAMKTERLDMMSEPGGYQPRAPDTGFEGYSLENFDHSNTGPVHQGEPWQDQRDNLMGNAEHTSGAFHAAPGNVAMDVSQMGNTEAFWQQLARGQTGLTPGVGLDDIFGTDGWNPLYMGQAPHDSGVGGPDG